MSPQEVNANVNCYDNVIIDFKETISIQVTRNTDKCSELEYTQLNRI